MNTRSPTTAWTGIAAAALTGLMGSALLSPGPAAGAAPGEPAPLKLQQIGRFDQPIYVAAAAGDRKRLYIVERRGRILVRYKSRVLRKPLLDITGRVGTEGEGGLLSMAFSPRFARNGKFYVNHTDRRGNTRIAEYKIGRDNRNRAIAKSRREILRIKQPYSNHNGGQLQFGPDRMLYIGMGDGGGAGDPDGNAQDLGSLLGKMLRIDPRPKGARAYRIPPENPFAGRNGARPEIYSYGLRNPWRFSFDRTSGALVIADVGQDAREEVHYAAAGAARGANFGWPAFEGSRRYSDAPAPGAAGPTLEVDHSEGWCSITGGYVARKARSAIHGRYVYGDFCSGEIRTALLTTDGARDERTTGLKVGNLVSFGEDAAGGLYAVSLGGAVYRLAG